jgi:hypothetical protein
LRLFLPPIRAQPFFAPLCDSLRPEQASSTHRPRECVRGRPLPPGDAGARRPGPETFNATVVARLFDGYGGRWPRQSSSDSGCLSAQLRSVESRGGGGCLRLDYRAFEWHVLADEVPDNVPIEAPPVLRGREQVVAYFRQLATDWDWRPEPRSSSTPGTAHSSCAALALCGDGRPGYAGLCALPRPGISTSIPCRGRSASDWTTIA